ncbi:glycosyltransferase [Mucilaginibacter lappiensis]|uniref:Glycosyltransferase involved in cell wall biosynthesis n=1 Tax=Mucilaginibacter lappiensis TaxID=354630 RepID=A0A841JIV2_9SPHI|nr:glycosyltransferase [Mucilaginibacter lappiensis]MBB6130867.1 glycosyltransferase involved in cell wall biosynthesis [Mucilaginibacter lappiensis]
MLFNLFNNTKITYGITVCNEATELDLLLTTIIPIIDKQDELIILQDVTSKDIAVSAVIEKYKDRVILIEAKLNDDFATFKNTLVTKASGNYLFQIDADEVPQQSLIKKLKWVLRKNWKYDCFFVPRINIVNGYTDAHINKWNWTINDKNYINFPDFQPRLIKLNGAIKWKNKVHEVLTGYKRGLNLPIKNYDYCLIHIKDIKRQERQNDFYDKLA